MFDPQLTQAFLDKVPDLRTPWRALLTVAYGLLLALACALFFYFIDPLGRFAPLVSQLIMALVVVALSYAHFRQAVAYRLKYGALAYRYFFYHLMLPYLVTWYACFFHPLFVSGPPLLPLPLALGLAVLFLALMVLATVHIERAGFHSITHGMDIYTIFPEEAAVVHGEIYAYIRHPLYFSLLCGGIGLALLRNNAVALGVALLQLLPTLAVGAMEDRELLQREGEKHRQYIQRTSALLPLKRLPGFLKMLLFRP